MALRTRDKITYPTQLIVRLSLPAIIVNPEETKLDRKMKFILNIEGKNGLSKYTQETSQNTNPTRFLI